MLMQRITKAFSIIGGIIGMCALPFQHLMYEMEAPNLSWVIKIPFLTVGFGVIAAGAVLVLMVIVGGIIELLDPNENWPRV